LPDPERGSVLEARYDKIVELDEMEVTVADLFDRANP
jgi:hypothetical protein